MTNVVSKFQTDDNVKECLHKYDTQHNERLNISVSHYFPKFKHYGTSMSLDTNERCIIGAHNMGYTTFYKTLLIKLGCLVESHKENSHLFSGTVLQELVKQSPAIKHTSNNYMSKGRGFMTNFPKQSDNYMKREWTEQKS